MKLKSNFKRILSGVMSLAMAATLLPSLPVVAEGQQKSIPIQCLPLLIQRGLSPLMLTISV